DPCGHREVQAEPGCQSLHQRPNHGQVVQQSQVPGKQCDLEKTPGTNFHKRMHSRQRRKIPTDCGKGFVCHSWLVRHQMTHTGERPYKCSECDKSYRRKDYLLNHLRRHSGEGLFQCSLCRKRFVLRRSFMKHQESHLQETHLALSFIRKQNLLKHQPPWPLAPQGSPCPPGLAATLLPHPCGPAPWGGSGSACKLGDGEWREMMAQHEA
uniref:C2H2-type domain-containing protein n=1 Tax=Amazona collaria TaxID=241587 RepID=A0A8B9F3I5_9PSIT